MNDFDKFFSDKLNEEEQFPRRDKNWKGLSKRLDAFDAGALGYSRPLRYWQAAAAVLLIGASVLFAKVISFRYENEDLRRQLVEFKTQAPERTVTLAPEDQVAAEANGKNGEHSEERAITPAAASAGQSTAAQTPSAIAERGGEKKNNSAAVPAGIPGSTHMSTNVNSKNTGQNNPLVQSPASPIDQQSTPVSPDDQQSTPAAPIDEPAATAGVDYNGDPVNTDGARSASRDFGPLTPLLTPLSSLPARLKKTPHWNLAPVAAAPAELIEPHRQAKDARFRIGVQATAGKPSPGVPGISTLSGAGLTAGFSIWRGIRLDLSADWLRYDVHVDRYVDRFNLPDQPKFPPGPFPGQHDSLTQITGSQRSQQFSTGIAYTVPLRTRIRPAIRLAHTLVRLPSSNYIFKLEDDDKPGHPPKIDYLPKRSKTGWFANNWRIGAGLEFDTPRWTIAAWADYSKSLSESSPLFDAVYLRAGVQYRFD